jgi:hypothetical protein
MVLTIFDYGINHKTSIESPLQSKPRKGIIDVSLLDRRCR